MRSHDHAIIWIDHQQARIFGFDSEALESAVILGTHPHEHLHHKANARDSGHVGIDKGFFERVRTSLEPMAAILITGPAGAKKELASYLRQEHPHLAERICGVEALDHPSDAQLVALGRKYFTAHDHLRSQQRC